MAQEVARPAQSEIVLWIDNSRPLPAQLVGELLSDLARDYRRQNRGRTLVVSQLYSGSVWAHLADLAQIAEPYAKNAVEIAKGGKALLDFGKGFQSAISKKKTAALSGDDPGTMPSQYRSVETVLRMAAETGSHIRIRQTGSDGSSIDVELSPGEAVQVREKANEAKRNLVSSTQETAKLIGVPPDEYHLPAARLADRLQSADSDVLVEAIMEAILLADGGHLIEQIASQLEGRGLYELAARIRDVKSAQILRQLPKY